jgi:hypothetical protein
MSERLMQALNGVKDFEEITLGSIVDHLQEEALLILCLVAILPFMQPIPIPGLSSILGIIVLFQGLGLVIWGKPVLTKKMRKITISKDKFDIVYRAAVKFNNITSKISTFKHPLAATRTAQIICGLAIIFSASFLSLPLPIPFSNLIPALSIFLMCIGLLEEDIMLIFMGMAITFAVFWMAVVSYGFIVEQVQLWI